MNIKKILLINIFNIIFNTLFITSIIAGPNSSNYELKNYSFGAGGTEGSSSTNFKVNGLLGEISNANSTKTYVSDKFSRTVSSGWGSADTGGIYTVLNGQAVDHNVNGSQGTILVNAANTERGIGLNTVNAQDINMMAKITTDKLANGSGLNAVLSGRIISTNSEYRTTLKILPDNSVRIFVSKVIGGTETVLTSEINPGLTYSLNNYFWLKQEIYGNNPTTINAKVWLEGTTEPIAWSISGLTDSTPTLQASGSVALKTFLDSNVTNAPVTFKFDDFSVVSHYSVNSGFVSTLMNTPLAPSLTNPSNWHNKLKLTLNPGFSPVDTTYAIEISNDNFTSNIQYVKNDNSVGSTLGLSDWQSYPSWGGNSGINISGLSSGTLYSVRVASKQGNYTQSDYGPIAQASTSDPSLTFDIDVGTNSSVDNSAPYAIDLGKLSPGATTTSTNSIWIDIDTNGSGGSNIYLLGTNNGLFSTTANNTISSASVDLDAVSTGYGGIGTFISQVSGGPMRYISPYDGTGNNVGAIDSTRRLIFDSTSQPVNGGRAAFGIKAKVKADTKAGNDYNDIIKVIATASF